jgi:DNA transformation protein
MSSTRLDAGATLRKVNCSQDSNMATKRMPASKPRRPALDEGHQPVRRDSMQEWLEDSLQSLPEIHVRRMFGGAGIYSEDTMFGILYSGRIYLKTNDDTRAAYADYGMVPFRVRSGTVLTSYYGVPPDILDDDEAFVSWAHRAITVAQAAPAKRKPRSK